MRILVFGAVCALLVSGCPKSQPAPTDEPFDAALSPYFDAGPLGALYLLTIYPHSAASGDTVPCTEGFCSDRATHVNLPGGMSLVANDAGLNILFETRRVGSTVTFDGHETKITQLRQDATFPQLLGRFADLPVHEHIVEVDVKVVTPGMKSESAKSKLDAGFLETKIQRAKEGPVLFPGETTSTPNAKKLAYVRPSNGGRPPMIIGDGRWRDIDLVGFVEVKWGQGEKCPQKRQFLENPRTGALTGKPELVDIYTQTLHSDVTLYDRRTGKVFDKTAIDGKGKCELDDAGTGLGALFTHSDTQLPDNDAAIAAWARSKLVP